MPVKEKLFQTGDHPDDHRWYRNMRDAVDGPGAQLRSFACHIFLAHRSLFDSNFVREFRRETPARFSELFYAAAFLNAGFLPAPRTLRFDLSFQLPDRPGRLLVEIITVAPPEKLGEYGERDGFTSVTFGAESREAAFLRLTGAVYTKAKIIDKAVDRGFATKDDYKIVAVSGVRLSQEGEWDLDGFGNPPDFAWPFLGISGMFMPLSIPLDVSTRPVSGPMNYSVSFELKRRSAESIRRDAFLSGFYPNVDAVAYSAVGLARLDPRKQVGVLHNPTSSWAGERLIIGCGADYIVRIADNEFELQRIPALVTDQAGDEP